MSAQGNNRSVSVGGGVTGASITTGDYNSVMTTSTQVQPPPAHDVDVTGEIAALRTLMKQLAVPEPCLLSRALDVASEEAIKPTPNKQDVASALERAVKMSKGAADFAQHAAEIEDRVIRLAGWLGPLAKGALGLLG